MSFEERVRTASMPKWFLEGGLGFLWVGSTAGPVFHVAVLTQMSKKKMRFYGRFINSTNAGEEGEDNGTGEDIVLSKISTGFFSS